MAGRLLLLLLLLLGLLLLLCAALPAEQGGGKAAPLPCSWERGVSLLHRLRGEAGGCRLDAGGDGERCCGPGSGHGPARLSGRFGFPWAEGLSAPVSIPHTAVERGAELRGQGAAGAARGQCRKGIARRSPRENSCPEVLPCVRGNLAKAWLHALGPGGSGHGGERVPALLCRQSEPKSEAASANNFSKAVNSSFSESDCLGFKTRSLACFWEYLASVDQCLLLLDVSKEGWRAWEKNEQLQKEAISSLQKHPLMGERNIRGDNPAGCVLSLSYHWRKGFKDK